MKAEEVQRLYDAGYASSYNEKFLNNAMTSPDAQHEEEVLRTLLTESGEWLDVACGTGYFLSRFPDARRVGLDLSLDMLAKAAAMNPGVELRQHDYRQPIPEWRNRFDLVSCMWYAYQYVDTIEEIVQWIGNLASWTSAEGRCFIPVGDPSLISRTSLPYRIEHGWPGGLVITGLLWSYVEDNGATIHNLVAPHIEFLKEQFEVHFLQVDVASYASSARQALIASGKRETS